MGSSKDDKKKSTSSKKRGGKSNTNKTSGSNKNSKSNKSGKGSSKSLKSKKSSKTCSGKPQQHHHHHHHHNQHGKGKPSHGPSISSNARSNQRKCSAKSSRHSDTKKGNFVMKGKQAPAGKESMLSPSRLLPDQMTTIYAIPNEHFKTEADVCAFNGYEVMEQIGKGGFAVVYKAKNTKTGQMCACKTVQIKDQDAIIEMKNELFIMEMVDNPFAIRLYLHFLVNETLYIFMQLADAGCFGKMLEKGGVLDEEQSQFYFAQMCCGVKHMHDKNIAHRDIKPANFLMAEHPSGKKIVLVSDYGLSRVVHKNEKGGPVMYTTRCGTPAYMAPEILSGNEYDCYLVDVWSLGVTLYAMLNLMTPFNVETDDYGVKEMVEGKWDWMTDEMKAPPSSGLDSITKGMLEPDPGKRLSMKDTVGHKWLAAQFESIQKLEPSRHSSKK